MKLSIIIPYHNEDSLKDTLCFLNLQQNVNYNDIEILIINNCYEPKSIDTFLEGLDKIKSSICYYNVPGDNGPGPSRQYGINIAKGEYIMMIDTGDYLYSILSLYDVMEHIKTNKDYYSYQFINVNQYGTYMDGGKNRSYSVAWDKIYNRKFLLDNDICFAPDILYEEDVHFTKLLINLECNWEGIDTPLYVHILNAQSLGCSVFSDINKFKRYIKDIIRSCEIEIEFIQKRHINKDVVTLFCPYPFWFMQTYIKEHPDEQEEVDSYVCSLWKEFNLKYNPSLKFYNADRCVHYLDETYPQFIKRNFPEVTII